MSDNEAKTQLVFIRHGDPCGDMHASTKPPAEGFLTHRGELQVEALRRICHGVTFDQVYASPLGRALQTADALVNQPEAIKVSDWLMEWRPASVMNQQPVDDDSYAALTETSTEIRPELAWKTAAGEGTLEMAHRVIPPLLSVLTDHGVTAAHGGFLVDTARRERADLRLAFVAHGGTLAMMLGFMLGLPLRPYAPFWFMHTGTAVLEFIRRVDVWYPELQIPASGSSLADNLEHHW